MNPEERKETGGLPDEAELLRRTAARRGELIEQLHAQLEAADERERALRGSLSWRITAPLRAVTRVLRRAVARTRLPRLACMAFKSLLTNGYAATMERVREHRSRGKSFRQVETAPPADRAAEERAFDFGAPLQISVLVPLYNTPARFLREMIASVQAQTYADWQLCLADGSDDAHADVGEICREAAALDGRICYRKLEKNGGISENTNACIALATGDYIALFDHDDVLHPSALFACRQAIAQGADFVYTDEATFVNGSLQAIEVCHYKPDFAPDTLRSNNYICHLSVFSRALLDAAGPFNSACDGSQDYDLILRLTERARHIVHIPRVLYFWRSHAASTAFAIATKPYVIEAAHRALEGHLARTGLRGTVRDAALISNYRIDYELERLPFVSILLPNAGSADELLPTLEAIAAKTAYCNFEIVAVDGRAGHPDAAALDALCDRFDRLRVLPWDGADNPAARLNFAAEHAGGELLLLLEQGGMPATETWIEALLMFAQRQDVGAVGGKLYRPDGAVRHAGLVVGQDDTAAFAHTGYRAPDYGYMGRAGFIHNVSALSAECLLIRRDRFFAHGGLDDGYQNALYDVDLCLKLRQESLLLVFTPYAALTLPTDRPIPLPAPADSPDAQRFRTRHAPALAAGDPYYSPNFPQEGPAYRYK